MDDAIATCDDLEIVTGIVARSNPPSLGPSVVAEWCGMAHDLGNLLQTAASAINIIDRGVAVLPDQIRRALDGAKLSVERAGELVRQSLERSLIGSNRIAQTDVAECLEELALLVGDPLAPGISLDIEVGEGLPPVSCDRSGLQNAVLNLLFNARDAIARNGHISIRAEAVVADASEVEISVTDNGVGMSAATVQRAFTPYFTTKGEGLGGIGLPMVERFVDASGGRILVESELGSGTVVRMSLPTSRFQQSKEI